MCVVYMCMYVCIYFEKSLGRVGMYFCEHCLLVFVHRIIVLSNGYQTVQKLNTKLTKEK